MEAVLEVSKPPLEIRSADSDHLGGHFDSLAGFCPLRWENIAVLPAFRHRM